MKFHKIALATSLLAFSSMSFADSGSYLGVGFGNTEVETGFTTTGTIDNEDSGFKLLFGKKLHDSFSLELAYHDYGESSLTWQTNDLITIDGVVYQFLEDGMISVSAESFALSGLFLNNFTSSFSGFGRIGLSMWEVEGKISGISGTIDDDGTDLLYGLGLQYDVNNSIGIRGEYEIHEDLDFLSLGVIARF